MEAKLLQCQAALALHRADLARALLEECSKIVVEEAEPRQHYLLTRAWLAFAAGDEDTAYESLEAASQVFTEHTRVGDHTPHLLCRFRRLPWTGPVRDRVVEWQALLNATTRAAG